MNDIELTPLIDTLRLEKIDDETYFSKKYSNYISNSRLSLIDPSKGGSPEQFFSGFKPLYSDSLILGSMVHELSLQEDLFKIVENVDRPTAKLGFLADELYKLNRDITDEDIRNAAFKIGYYKGNLTQNMIDSVRSKCAKYIETRRKFESNYKGDKSLIYADPKIREKGKECIKALKENKKIQDLLHPTNDFIGIVSENEKAILLDIKVTTDSSEFILKLKAKLDNYTIDTLSNEICVNDIKTLGRILSEFDINISNYSYNREIALYSWLLSLCAKKYYDIDNPIIKGNYLVVSTIPKYYTKVVPMTKNMYKEGWNEFIYLFKLVAHYYDSGYRFK